MSAELAESTKAHTPEKSGSTSTLGCSKRLRKCYSDYCYRAKQLLLLPRGTSLLHKHNKRHRNLAYIHAQSEDLTNINIKPQQTSRRPSRNGHTCAYQRLSGVPQNDLNIAASWRACLDAASNEYVAGMWLRLQASG